MLIGKIENGKVTQIGELTEIFSGVSFGTYGPTSRWLEENGYKKITNSININPATQKLVPSDPYIGDNEIFTMRVQEFSEEELESQRTERLNDIRQRRNQLLRETDWTQLPDAPSGTAEMYRAYRQALRDFPETCNDRAPEWPIDPNPLNVDQ